MSRNPDCNARTERVAISFTPEEWADLNAMRIAAGGVSMSTFVRGLLLDVVEDDKSAHGDDDTIGEGAR